MGSWLGGKLSLTETSTWADIIAKLKGVSLSGTASAAQVLTGKTFYNTTLSKVTGTMANKGALNWAPTTSTTYSVAAGYYSGGTLNSSGAYTAGYNAGVSDSNVIKYTSGSVTSVNSSKPVGSRMFTIWNIGFNPVMVFAYGGGHTNYHSFRYVNSMFWSQSSTGFSNVSGYASSFSFTSSSIELPTLEAANTTIYYFAVGYV